MSAFVGRGQRTAWAVWESFPELTDALSEVNHEHLDITESYMSIIARFVILIYDRTSTCSDINTARNKLFAKKVRHLESIPPTHHALVQHVWRAVYQGGLFWGQALYAQPELPSTSQWGWKKHLTVSLNRFGQHYRKSQRSAMNLSGVDSQNDALVAAGVGSIYFHARRFVLVMRNVTETRTIK